MGRTLATALLFSAPFAGCDGEGGGGAKSDLEVGFVSPGEGATLDCGDDLDRDTTDVLDYNVEALVVLRGADPGGLTARLTAEGHPGLSRTAPVPASGRVLFGHAPLPLGEGVVLRVDLLDGERVLASARRTIDTHIDPEAEACREAPPPPTLSFEAPTHGAVFGTDDDADGTLANGLQTTITVGVGELKSGRVTLDVDDRPAGEADVVDGRATFEGVTLPVGDGDRQVVLTARVPGTSARAEIRVRIAIDACTLTLSPQPDGMGCDVLADADVDPNEPGIQTVLVAESNCARVVFNVNGRDTAPVPVEDGVARVEVTLVDGENTLGARALNDGGLTGRVTPYVLVADATAPVLRLALDEMGVNTFGHAGQERRPEGGFRATVGGTAEGLPAGSTVRFAFDPPLPGDVATEATVAADGTFTLSADIDAYACGRTLTVTATDDCNLQGTSPAYAVCFDPVEPAVTLTGPADGATFGPGADVRPGEPGLQVPMTVVVADPRPAAVDYDVFVECQVPGQVWSDRFTRAVDRRRRADADEAGAVEVLVTFAPTDLGEVRCRGAAAAAPNPAVPQADPPRFTVIQEQPTFAIAEPTAGQCSGDGEVVVGGSGRRLTANDARLEAVLTPEGGEPGAPVPLDAEAHDVYAVGFGAAGGPEALPDGRYTVTVAGRVRGDVPVAVSPAAGVEFVVDTTAPTIELLAPADGAELGLEDDADGDLANCVQTELQLRLTDLSADRLCYSLNGSAEFCAPVDEHGEWRPAVDLLDGDNVVAVRAVDCGGHETRREFHLHAQGCPPRIVVAGPVDGSRVAAHADVDPATPGLQLDVRLASALAPGAEVLVAVLSDAQEETFGPVAVDDEGAATVRVTVDLPAAIEGPFEFRLQGRLADGSATGPAARVTYLAAPPTLELPALDACLNAEAVDAAVAPGFQLALAATTAGVDPGTVATLTATCPGVPAAEVTGVVGADGAVVFAPITLPDDATCTLTARVTDAAGQEGSAAVPVRVDRVAPTIQFTVPADGAQVTKADDELDGEGMEEQGIQLTPRLNVCGAAGQTLVVETEPALTEGGEPLEVALGDGACENVALGRFTLPAGNLEFRSRATDACGNEAVVVSRARVNPASALSIRLPTHQSRILAEDDEDPETEGCQIELVALASEIGAEAEYFVCTDADQGEGPAACDGRSSALAPEGCVVRPGPGESDPVVHCMLNLRDGAHTLSVVGVFGEPVESDPVSVLVDCSRPTVQAFTVPQDADASACINRMERRRPTRVSDRAEFDLRAQVDGLEDGRTLTLRAAPSGNRVSSAVAAGGEVLFPLDLDPGVYNLYLSGSDLAGNRLPELGEDGVLIHRVEIDTVPPVTQLVGLAADACLNAGADAQGGQPGLQYAVRATAQGAPGEALTGELVIDGGAPVVQAAVGGQVLFPEQSIGEGPHQIAVTVRDACGNVASAAGFELAEGVDDWSRPLAVPFTVDTVAPSPVVAGLVNGQELTDEDDADGNPANGFQADLTVDFDPRGGIEPGRPVELRSNDRPLASQPAVLSVPADFAAPLAARVNLAPGEHAIVARAADACGNVGVSAPVAVTARLSGCLNTLLFAEGPVVFGPADGAVAGGALVVPAIDGQVSVDLNGDCVGAQAELLAGPAGGEQVLGTVAVPADGALRFTDVALPKGIHDLKVRVTLNDRPTFSAEERVVVDLDAPTVTVTTPAGPDPAPVYADTDGNPDNGLQTTVGVRVTEADVATNSARRATLEVDGVQVAEQAALAQQSPLDVTFANVTLAEGPATLRVCVTDEAGNQGCATQEVLVDPAPPGAIELTTEVVHPRTTEVELRFPAPGDNGDEGGPVARFEVRRAAAAIADEGAWELATSVEVFENTLEALGDGAPFGPGADVTLALVDDTALPLNRRHFVAVRAVDDAGRLGPIASAEVDLRLRTTQFDIGPVDYWPSDTFLNQRSMLQGVGDLNGDGRGDALVSAFAWNNGDFRQVSVILSGPGEVADFQVVPLQVPEVAGLPLASFGGHAAGVGDVDGDGRPDIAVVASTGDYTAGAVALYFGSDDPEELATADAVILTPGRYVSYVAGIGNFNHLADDGDVAFADLAIGGATGVGSNFVNVVAGRPRAAWAVASPLDASVYDAANGVIRLVAPGDRAGRSIAASDIDGDGRTEVLFSTGNNWGRVFLFAGGDQLPAELSHPVGGDGSQELAHLCPPEPGGAVSFWGSNLLGGVDLDGQPGEDFVVGDYNLKRVVPVSAALQSLDCFSRSPASYGAYMNPVGDVNADGNVDLIVGHLDDGNANAHIFYNDGQGRFGGAEVNGQRTADITLDGIPRRKRGIAGLGDIDGDGFDDFGVVYKEPGGALRAVLYY